MKKIFEKDFRGRKIIVEHGELAKQANGSVLVRYGDTVVLTAAVVSKSANVLSDFFPLMVLYNEKLYSVGKIPGGFIKREGRPTENATLAARMIDRPLRPLFPEDFKNEVQIVNTVLSVDQDNSPELTALFGSSLATCISKIPFNGPVAGVKVGRVDGKFVINPTVEEIEVSDIDLTVAGTYDAINMVEAGSKEVSEADMLEALMFGHEAVKELIGFQEKIIEEIGEEKMEYERLEISSELRNEVETFCRDRVDAALRIKDKLENGRVQTVSDIISNENGGVKPISDGSLEVSNTNEIIEMLQIQTQLHKDKENKILVEQKRGATTTEKVKAYQDIINDDSRKVNANEFNDGSRRVNSRPTKRGKSNYSDISTEITEILKRKKQEVRV